MLGTSVVLDKLRLLWETEGGDVAHAAEIYHDDAVVEFPQSGERFEGIANFTEWRSQYPAQVSFRLRRVTVREDLAVCEISASYDGGTEMIGVQLLDCHRQQGDTRTDLCRGSPGGSRMAGALALGHSCRSARRLAAPQRHRPGLTELSMAST